ncbi:MAG: CPBP family intramembrane metalloprotease [Planctomycetaceae bacterium]|jgi:membrane protease YdiL (CAAX protease family)|nr:CPBP family intramembrane metalloprotease [Planctomycetaceae bacterium]
MILNINGANSEPSTQSEMSASKCWVSWNGFDVFLLFFLWLILLSGSVQMMLHVFSEQTDSLNIPAQAKTTTHHPLSQLLEQGKNSPIILFVAFFCGVITAPLTEEFLFRLLFQGWLEKKSNDWRFGVSLSEYFPFRFLFLPGFFSIVVVSVLFALAHGGKRIEQPVDVQFYSMIGVGMTNVFVFCFGMFYLTVIRGTTVQELGFQTNRIGKDVFLAAGIFVLSAPLIFFLHWLLQNNFPNRVTDPVPLFIFSIILGSLYYRTGRLFPCILLHAFLNSFSFAVLVSS